MSTVTGRAFIVPFCKGSLPRNTRGVAQVFEIKLMTFSACLHSSTRWAVWLVTIKSLLNT